MWNKLYSLSITIVLFVTVSTYGQLPSRIIKQYHQLINKAELSICDGKFTEALISYKQAAKIRSLNKMCSSDLYNYFITAVDLQQYPVARQILRPLIARGWGRVAFSRRMALYYDSVHVRKLMQLYDAVGVQSFVLDTLYRRKIDSIDYIDERENRAIRSRDSGYMRGEGLRYYEHLTVNNMAALKELFEQKPPSDYIVGRFGDNEPVERVPYDIVLVHNAQSRTFVDNWSENAGLYNALFKAVCTADYDPDEFANFISSPFATNKDSAVRDLGDITLTLPLSNLDFIAIHDSLFEFKGCMENKEEFNRRRALVPGLCNLESYRRKVIYQFYHKKYRFIPGGVIEHGDQFPMSFRKSLVLCNPMTH